MKLIHGSSFANVYQKILGEINSLPEFITSPRGLEIKEILNLCVEIYDPTSNLFINEIRSPNYKYLAGELFWYFSGRRDLEFIEKYSKFWKHIANEDKTLNSAYGYLIFKEQNKYGFTPWQWALKSLVKDKHTRQAIMHFNKPDYLFDGNKDLICTCHSIFNIREDKLYMTIVMRSQDEIKGRTYDVPFFTLLQQQMRNLLLPHYPNLGLGSFYHINTSSHCYETDFELVQKMMWHEFKKDGLPPLRENLVDINGNFDEHNFFNSNDELIVWIRSRLKT
ncbi:thymidylate synthase [Candidatus Dojkabacteria bacterium]|jgi:thymidylate synthase|nr:thymidylate synthase [Candidatus Dojkabacteria bacterium]